MRLSLAALGALLLGSTTAFVIVPSCPKSFASKSTLYAAPVLPTPKIRSTTPISTDTIKMKNLLEARGCLLEIETAAEQAREYLEYLEKVATGIRVYLKDQSAPVQDLDLPQVQNTYDAAEYLGNIETATASAIEYVEYLENMASGIKEYLSKLDQEYSSQETIQKTRQAETHLDELEETAQAARDYLVYLQSVADAVQDYLVDPNLEGIQKFMPPRVEGGIQGIRDYVKERNVGEAPSLEDELDPRATRVIDKQQQQQQQVMPPIAPPLQVDTTAEQSRPIKRIQAPTPKVEEPVVETVPTTPVETVPPVAETEDATTHVNRPEPRKSWVTPQEVVRQQQSSAFFNPADVRPARSSRETSYPKSGSPPQGGAALQSFLDNAVASSSSLQETTTTTKPAASDGTLVSGGGSSSYLDSINNPPPQHTTGTTPTSHFKESADSTPFAQVGPPGRGRSDVSHMDNMDSKDEMGYSSFSPQNRKEGEAIPAKLPFLGAAYMDQLQRAANKNPLILKDELEKKRVDKEQVEEPVREEKVGKSIYIHPMPNDVR